MPQVAGELSGSALCAKTGMPVARPESRSPLHAHPAPMDMNTATTGMLQRYSVQESCGGGWRVLLWPEAGTMKHDAVASSTSSPKSERAPSGGSHDRVCD